MLPSCSSTARGLLGAGRGWISSPPPPLALLLAASTELVLASPSAPAFVDCCCCWTCTACCCCCCCCCCEVAAAAAAAAAAGGSTTTATCGGRRETSPSSLPSSSSSLGTGWASAGRRPRSQPRKPASERPCGPPALCCSTASHELLLATSWPSAGGSGGCSSRERRTRQARGVGASPRRPHSPSSRRWVSPCPGAGPAWAAPARSLIARA